MLGLYNTANNRETVRQLKLQMKGAFEGEVSELVEIETENVIQQLIAQLNILERQEKLEERIGELQEEQEKQSEEIEERIRVYLTPMMKNLIKS